MKEVVEYIVKSLVDNQNAVDVTVEEKGNGETVIHINVAEEDMGRVIGKNGRCANAIRTLIQASSSLKDNKYVKIDIDKF